MVGALIAREIGMGDEDGHLLRCLTGCGATCYCFRLRARPAGQHAHDLGKQAFALSSIWRCNIIGNYIRIENVVAVHLAQSVAQPHKFSRADRCALVRNDNDVNAGSHYHDTNGTTSKVLDITGSARAKFIQ